MRDVLLGALDLMRRMPPAELQENLSSLIDLAPDLTEDLLSTVDQPLQKEKDSSGRAFLICDYNRDMDSYRSVSSQNIFLLTSCLQISLD